MVVILAIDRGRQVREQRMQNQAHMTAMPTEARLPSMQRMHGACAHERRH